MVAGFSWDFHGVFALESWGRRFLAWAWNDDGDGDVGDHQTGDEAIVQGRWFAHVDPQPISR